MDDVRLAYLAGLFDGEGTIVIAKYKQKARKNPRDYYFLRLKVSNKCKEVIELFRDTFGVGCIYCDKRQGVWDWATNATAKTKQIVELLSPFLRVKRDQARLALEFVSLQSDSEKERMKLTISSVNHGRYVPRDNGFPMLCQYGSIRCIYSC